MKRSVPNDAGIEQQLQAADDMAYMEIEFCDRCGVNPADSPSKHCIGCDAYQEHLEIAPYEVGRN